MQVRPGAKENRVIEKDGYVEVWTKERAEKGKANKAVIELLARYFGVSKVDVRIRAGAKQREKVIEISSMD